MQIMEIQMTPLWQEFYVFYWYRGIFLESYIEKLRNKQIYFNEFYSLEGKNLFCFI